MESIRGFFSWLNWSDSCLIVFFGSNWSNWNPLELQETRPTPRKTNMSPENQWLEDVFPIPDAQCLAYLHLVDFMVNVGKLTIHWVSGYWNSPFFLVTFKGLSFIFGGVPTFGRSIIHHHSSCYGMVYLRYLKQLFSLTGFLCKKHGVETRFFPGIIKICIVKSQLGHRRFLKWFEIWNQIHQITIRISSF